MKSVLIADDEVIETELYKEIIEDLGYRVYVVYTGKDAVEAAKKIKPDIVLLDIKMEHRTSGIEAAQQIKKCLPCVKAYLLTAYLRETFENELSGMDFDGYIDKLSFVDVIEEILKK